MSMNASSKEKEILPVSSLADTLSHSLDELATEYTSLSETKSVVESRQKEIRIFIASELDNAQISSVSIESAHKWRINPITRTTSKLDSQLLLANGVGMETIEACTIVSQSRTFEIRNLSETKAAKEARQASALEGRSQFPHQMDDNFDSKGDG